MPPREPPACECGRKEPVPEPRTLRSRFCSSWESPRANARLPQSRKDPLCREREHVEWCSAGRLRARRSLSRVLVLPGGIEPATLLRWSAHLILNKLCHPHPHKGGGLGYGASPILWVPTPAERAPGFSRGLELSEMPPASRVPRTEDGEGEWKGTQEVSGDWCVVGREGSAEE